MICTEVRLARFSLARFLQLVNGVSAPRRDEDMDDVEDDFPEVKMEELIDAVSVLKI